MKTIDRFPLSILAGAMALSLSCSEQPEATHSLRLWYDRPANASIADARDGWKNDAEWLKALPVGNGFLGAMVFGDVNRERIQLNEKSLWSGSPDDNDNPNAYASLGRIRQLEWREEFKEIDPQKTPELASAARKSLEARTDIGTGWSLAWKVNFWARLKDGNRAHQLLKHLLRPTDTMVTGRSRQRQRRERCMS